MIFFVANFKYSKSHFFSFQGFCAGIVMILCFAAVTTIPIGDALTVVYSSPIFTMIFSAIFLGSRLRLYKITLGLVLSLGIVLVVKPPFLFPDIANHTFNNSSNINRYFFYNDLFIKTGFKQSKAQSDNLCFSFFY